jgi:hypothetical protein
VISFTRFPWVLLAEGLTRPLKSPSRPLRPVMSTSLSRVCPGATKSAHLQAVQVFKEAAVENTRLEREAAEYRAQAGSRRETGDDRELQASQTAP